MTRIHLDRLLTLENPTRVPDSAGGFSITWTALGTLWAEVTPGNGNDAAGEEVVLSSVPSRITVRAAPVGAVSRPLPDQRFRDGSRIFKILAVTERGRLAKHLICSAREEVLK
ncbi:MAG: head-tail adaptor protein [Microgenomates group bacterium]